ncbi:mitochondrial sodium/calcium exchanger protein isoform X1 [Electrophorus electricus]|uniref:Sodium/calcium exchanger membrane region domain-containing protein n=1 Tax=Electrophorus electricus TaxID=8005 RepID=A0A4W4EJH9_ELEEL|nr:mitochondrial sodium/calcium exchanger protein isoform X1 [Electrophorus electricus]
MRSVLLIATLITALRSDYVASQNPSALSQLTAVNRTASGNNRAKENAITPTVYVLKNSQDQCDKVMNLSASQRCEFVRSTPDCAADGGFINYPWITFCLLSPKLLPLAIFLYIVWLLVLFLVLGLIASEFFCPNLSAISSTLRLTHNVAGVTFLALGNGAPDVFSAMAAFSHPQTAGLAIGALFGAGIFVTTVVAGSIALVKPFTAASRPFLRDVIFYMAAVFWTFIILYRGHIDLRETFGYLGLYILYVVTVVVSACVYNRRIRSHSGTVQDSVQEFDHNIENSYTENLNGNIHVQDEYEPLLPFTESTANIFLKAINPVDTRTWRRSHWGWKVLKIIQLPFEMVLLLTVPLVDSDKEDRNWKRPLNCLHLITAPLVCVLTFKSGIYGLYLIEGAIPVWLLTALIGVFLSGMVFYSTTNEHPPPYHFLFSLLGFVVSALWINVVASEVVNVLHLLGVILRLSNTVLGLTLLAWGNSIGDCFADITIARQGYPRMAISACFGGIIFNMLFGVGLGCLLQMLTHNNGFVMLQPEGLLCWVLAAALGLSLVLSFVLVPLQCFHLSRAYGVFLLLFYVVFLIIALLTEFGKISV